MGYEYRNLPESEGASRTDFQATGENKHVDPPTAAGFGIRLQRSSCVITMVAAVILAVATLTGFLVGSTATRLATLGMQDVGSTVEELTQIEDCGETPAQAKTNGCRYDIMIQQWVPAACYDEEHSELYISTYNFTWYYDIDAQHVMPNEIVRRGEHQVAFTMDDYHRHHCAYVWEVTARVFQQQKPVLDEWLSYKHVHHCNMILLSPPWNYTKYPTAVEAHSGYGRCAPYRLWGKDMPE